MRYYILIDASYFIFYRSYALFNWWKLSHKDESCDNVHLNAEFLSKFKETFITKLREMPKKLQIAKEYHSKITFIIGRDCKRENIWRMHLYPNYKATRDNNKNNSFNPGELFKLVYRENLFNSSLNELIILHHESLEADDCLAITTKYIETNSKEEYKIFIITSDTDYMQLSSPNVELINMKYKNVITDKNTYGNPKKDLLFKIIVGDKCDNIPSVFSKCGKKTAEKYINNIALFKEKLNNSRLAMNQYKLNRQLIDFSQIPENYVNQIEELLSQKFPNV